MKKRKRKTEKSKMLKAKNSTDDSLSFWLYFGGKKKNI